MIGDFELDEQLDDEPSNSKQLVKVHWSFWLIGLFALLWNAMGCMNFFWQMNLTSEKFATLSEAQNALIVGRPAWVTFAFAVAVVAGTLGSLLMLFKQSASLHIFLLSLIGIFVSILPIYGVINSGTSFTVFEFAMYVIATPLLGLFLVWYAKYGIKKGWLR